MTAAQNKEGTTEFEVPHVYEVMLKILTFMSVEKGGTLPTNMGGKEYITAQDLNAEAKRQFVAEGVVIIPSERFMEYQTVPRGDRAPTIVVAVEGSYRLYSTKDGSAVTISGVGDGLASGTSVASNIASTNALKNALLRAFLITEQSVEDQAKGDAREPEEKPKPRALSTAENGATQKSDAAKKVTDLQDKVRKAWAERHPEDMDGYTALGISKYGDPAGWATNQTKLKGLISAIEAGEVG